MADPNRPQYLEVSVDLAAGEIGVNRGGGGGGDAGLGPLLDRSDGVPSTLNLAEAWQKYGRFGSWAAFRSLDRRFRSGIATALLLFGLLLFLATLIEWNNEFEPPCSKPLQAWSLTQAVASYVAVLLTAVSRWMLTRSGAARGFKELFLSVVARLLNLFMLVWYIVGLVWLPSLPACAASVPMTFSMTLLMLLVETVCLMAFVIMFSCSCLIVVSRMLFLSRDHLREPRRDGATEDEITELTEEVPFDAANFPEREDAKCVVCLGDYEEGDQLRRLACGHQFHVECVDEWLKRHRTCPLCVQEISSAQ